MHEHERPTDPPEPRLEDFQRARALPPPAFPPGFRRVSVRRRLERQARVTSTPDRSPFPDEAFISPDEPIGRLAERDPYILPDDPLPRRTAAPDAGAPVDPEEVVVTGMGDDAHLGPRPFGPSDDPHVAALLEQIFSLAEGLRVHGELGLEDHSGISRFEATLRAYCRGYLHARRAEDERAG